MRGINKCFLIQLRDQFKNLNYQDVFNQQYSEPEFVVFRINWTIAYYVDSMSMAITGNDDPLSTSSLFSIFSPFEETTGTLTYDTYKSKLLEYPYQTDCRNYTKDNFISKGHCHEQCVKHIVAPALTFDSEKDNHTLFVREKIQEAVSFCDKKCSQRECESKKYIARLVSLQANRGNAFVSLYVRRYSA